MEILGTLFGSLLTYPIRMRNQAADCFFYDVEALTLAEREALSPLVDMKGTIIVVPPRATGDVIRQYKTAFGFMLEEGDRIEMLAVAGVGSSVLGTAALARNVADHYEQDVAGIVTGYGLADIAVEGLGGYFYYGMIDRLRYKVERHVDRMLAPQLPDARREALTVAARAGVSDEAARAAAGETRTLVPDFGYPLGSLDALGNSDVRALRDILLAGPPKLRLLVGHSKGNFLIGFVLNHMKDELEAMADELRNRHHPLFNHLSVVTLGAVVDLPIDAFDLNACQFLGQFDALGQINSDRDPPFLGKIATEHAVIPGAGHHLNRRIPCHLSVDHVLGRVKLPPAGDASRREIEGEARSTTPSWGGWPSIVSRGRAIVPRTERPQQVLDESGRILEPPG